jgi:hypothetical protein
MSAEKLYSEILDEFQKAETKQDRIAVLKKYDHKTFREFLMYAFNPHIKFDVQIPNYRPAPEPEGLNYTYLNLEIPKLYRFIVGHPKRSPNLTPKKQTQILLVILEALYKEEAEILVRLLKKDLGIKYLTPKLIKEAYPGM